MAIQLTSQLTTVKHYCCYKKVNGKKILVHKIGCHLVHAVKLTFYIRATFSGLHFALGQGRLHFRAIWLNFALGQSTSTTGTF